MDNTGASPPTPEDDGDMEWIAITDGRPEEQIYRAPMWQVTHGFLAVTPDSIEDDSPAAPCLYLELKRQGDPDDSALLCVMAPQAAIRMSISLLLHYDQVVVEHIAATQQHKGDDNVD